MKTIQLANLTALISSVVATDNKADWAEPLEMPHDEDLAPALPALDEDPELAADLAEFEKSVDLSEPLENPEAPRKKPSRAAKPTQRRRAA